MKELIEETVKKERGLRCHLEIHTDSDYSGKLCWQADEWYDAYVKERDELKKDDPEN